MLGRKKKREIEKDEGEENGLHKNKSLLVYQNKSLCTLINDLRNKLKSKEESYTSLETKFNSIISFFNIFTSTINSLNEEISSSLKKNKISVDEKSTAKGENSVYSSPAEFIHNLLGNEKNNVNQSTQQQNSLVNSSSNNKIIVDDEEEEEMKEQKNKKRKRI
jgi:hypothetical protein